MAIKKYEFIINLRLRQLYISLKNHSDILIEKINIFLNHKFKNIEKLLEYYSRFKQYKSFFITYELLKELNKLHESISLISYNKKSRYNYIIINLKITKTT